MHSKRNKKQNEKTTHRLNDVTNKGLVSKIYKQLTRLNNIKTNNSTDKWAEEPNRNFSRDTDDQEAREKMFNIANY